MSSKAQQNMLPFIKGVFMNLHYLKVFPKQLVHSLCPQF